MWEFYGIMTATNQAGLSNQFIEDEGTNVDSDRPTRHRKEQFETAKSA